MRTRVDEAHGKAPCQGFESGDHLEPELCFKSVRSPRVDASI